MFWENRDSGFISRPKISFVPKPKRVVLNKDSSDDEQETKNRKSESKQLAILASKEEPVKETADILPFEEPTVPDDNDFEANHQEEFDSWVEREKTRIRNEIVKIAEKLVEQRKTDRNKNLDDKTLEEIKKSNRKKKGKMLFMQKYYHKGAFSIDGDERANELANRDFLEPVGNDMIDKSILPDILVTRGDEPAIKKGKTKWTHLANEDTTNPQYRKTMAFLARGKK